MVLYHTPDHGSQSIENLALKKLIIIFKLSFYCLGLYFVVVDTC